MIFFNSKSKKKMIKLLKDSEQDFRFDEQRVKDRLLYSLRETPIKAPARTFFTFRFMKYSALVAGLVIFLSATFVLALNANPGDRLFGLNKFGENVILSLPLSMEQKAQVQAGIVTRRLEALQEIEAQPAGPGLETKQLETIKESDESIQNAIDTVTANKVKLENSGQTASAEKLGKVLDQIDTLAKKHEDRIKTIETQMPDQKAQQTIDNHLNGIKNSRQKASIELQSQKTDDPVDSADPQPQEQKTDDPAEPQPQQMKDTNPVKGRQQKKTKDNNSAEPQPQKMKPDDPVNSSEQKSQQQKPDNSVEHKSRKRTKDNNSGN
ncbi:MAG: hypothetical protein WDN47_03345 [Candidatus Doudnabacteria bacterium]